MFPVIFDDLSLARSPKSLRLEGLMPQWILAPYAECLSFSSSSVYVTSRKKKWIKDTNDFSPKSVGGIKHFCINCIFECDGQFISRCQLMSGIFITSSFVQYLEDRRRFKKHYIIRHFDVYGPIQQDPCTFRNGLSSSSIQGHCNTQIQSQKTVRRLKRNRNDLKTVFEATWERCDLKKQIAEHVGTILNKYWWIMIIKHELIC